MSLDTTTIQPIQNYIVRDTPVTFLSIDAACYHLYRTLLIDVAYLIIAESDYDSFAKQITERVNVSYTPPLPEGAVAEDYLKRRFSKIIQYRNQATGHLMDVFVSDQLSTGTIIFGVYQALDTGAIPVLAKQDVLAGKF